MKKIIVSLFTFVMGLSALAAVEDAQNRRFLLNQVKPSMARLGKEVIDGKRHVLRGRWDFDSQGGNSTAVIPLEDPEGASVVLPEDAIVTNTFVEVLTSVTAGAGSTVKFSVGSSQDPTVLLSASVLPAAGLFLQGSQGGSVVQFYKNSGTADSTLVLKTSINTPTAGKVNVFVEYILSEGD